jgi:nucleoside phosphorylase
MAKFKMRVIEERDDRRRQIANYNQDKEVEMLGGCLIGACVIIGVLFLCLLAVSAKVAP